MTQVIQIVWVIRPTFNPDLEACGIYVAIVNEAVGLDNGIVQRAKLWESGACPLDFFKNNIIFSEIKFYGNFKFDTSWDQSH